MKKYFLIILFFPLFFPLLSSAKKIEKKDIFYPLHCEPRTIVYSEDDLLHDIEHGVPYETALVLFDEAQNRVKILSDSQGNDAHHQWLANINQVSSEPANPYFSEYIYSDDILGIESHSYGLRSVTLLNCMGPYDLNAAPDAFGIFYPRLSQHLSTHPYFFYRISYFD